MQSRAWLDIRPFFCAEKMLLEFEKKLADFIDANELLGSATKILLAISGGADSVALMYAMHALKTENVIKTELLCAHINHQLRGTEGDLDEKFVVTQVRKLNLAVTTRQIDVREFARLNKLSIETTARQLRMEALIEIAKASNCSRVMTAHQKNDNAETILQRLSRGTGFRGLGGIWPERVFADEIKFIRPLLCFTRNEILDYLRKRNLNWRCDHTNTDCTYRRNYIRHRLIPALQKDCSDSVVEQLSRLAQSARSYYSMVCNCVDELWPRLTDCDGDKIVLDLEPFLVESQPVKVELIRRSLAAIDCGERCITQGHYEGILQLAEQNVSGRKIELPGRFVIRREYGNLVFSNCRMGNSFAHAASQTAWAGRPAHPTSASVIVEIPGQATFENFLIHVVIFEKNEVDFEKFKEDKTDSIEWFDLDKIKPPLTIRFRRSGDRFIPLGQSQEKKLGKFLTAQRVPHRIRKDILVFADSEKIIWVWPVRISEQSKINGQTQKILQLKMTNLNT
jgi:tRNA(Ile)-lysidine synthase